MIKNKGVDIDDYTISPVIRQSLQHWGYKVTKKDAIDKEMAKRLEAVQDTIEKEKQAALDSIKKGVASLSVEIAEKILEKKLESDSIQEELINNGLEKLDIK